MAAGRRLLPRGADHEGAARADEGGAPEPERRGGGAGARLTERATARRDGAPLPPETGHEITEACERLPVGERPVAGNDGIEVERQDTVEGRRPVGDRAAGREVDVRVV